MKLALRLALCFAVLVTFAGVLLLFGGVLTVKASASTIPGDPLYGVKRTWEGVQLTTTIRERSRQELLTRMATERRAEIAKLLQLRRDTVVEFDGVLEQISADHFVVSGITTNITAQTVIEGTPFVGHKVGMQGRIKPNGQLIVLKLDIEDTTPRGTMPAVSPTRTPEPTFTAVRSITPTSTAAPSPTPKHTVVPPMVPLLNCDDDDCGDDDGEDDDGEDDDEEDDDVDDDGEDEDDDDGEDD